MEDAISLISSIVEVIPWIDSADRLVAVWMPDICPAISSVALAVCAARLPTSEATTANPLPASPALAASIVAAVAIYAAISSAPTIRTLDINLYRACCPPSCGSRKVSIESP